jgi:hypothetical protein
VSGAKSTRKFSRSRARYITRATAARPTPMHEQPISTPCSVPSEPR